MKIYLYACLMLGLLCGCKGDPKKPVVKSENAQTQPEKTSQPEPKAEVETPQKKAEATPAPAQQPAEATPAPQPAKVVEAPHEPEPYWYKPHKMLGISKVGDAFIALNSFVDNDKEGQFVRAKNGMKLVSVELIINTHKEEFDVNSFYFKIKDKSGGVYNSGMTSRKPSLKAGKVEPGDKVRGWLSFEVPENAVELRIQYDKFGTKSRWIYTSEAHDGANGQKQK